MRAWGLRITFAYGANDRFLGLAEARFQTKRERDAFLSKLPATEYSPFTVDVMRGFDIEDYRYIDYGTVERLTGKAISTLIFEAATRAECAATADANAGQWRDLRDPMHTKKPESGRG